MNRKSLMIRGLMASLVVFAAFAFTPTLSSAPDKSLSTSSYTLFESGQVRPLAMSSDKRRGGAEGL